ncbi:uncharacterized protein LOC121985116 [Zingiber officinale]|uniref:uncharacterized protein LOC121985116 n=1 Tax=Zingiber officinale TaxID=94328 RepID=UPI001C4BE70A|nr:uncharacterized protein LOC121985116 [Zingiber officinale]
MKNGIRCFLSCFLPCGTLDVVRVVHPSGRVDEIAAPVTAADVMLTHPNHAVLHHPPAALLPPHARLHRGRIYFLVPVGSHKAAPLPRAHAPAKSKSANGWGGEKDGGGKSAPEQLSRDHRSRRGGRVGAWRPHLESIVEISTIEFN